MPVNVNPLDSKLKLQLNGGVDGEGNEVVKSKTYSKVKAAATDQDVFDVATALTQLQALPVLAIRRIEETELTQVI